MVMKFWVPKSRHYFVNIKDCSFASVLYFRYIKCSSKHESAFVTIRRLKTQEESGATRE